MNRSQSTAGREPPEKREALLSEELAADGESLVARTLKAGFALLRFPAELESEFRATHAAALRRWVRMSLFVALSTTVGFAIIDHWLLIGPRAAATDLVRFGLQLPCVLIMLLTTSRKLYARWYPPGIQIAAPLFGIGTVVLVMGSPPDHAALICSRLLLATFFFYFMIGLPFYAAVRTNLIMVGAFGAAALAGAIPPLIGTYALFVLLCANIIGGAGAYALEHANRAAFLDRRRIREVALHDGLTGLLNRTAFEEQIRRIWAEAASVGATLAVLMIDIDHFKAYNDRYGHLAGDECLRRVAETTRRVVRQMAPPGPLDFVARYGGDELIAVLSVPSRPHAETVAHAICRGVAEARIPHIASPTQPYVTASIGAALCEPARDSSHDAAVSLADAALYAAKEQGRDRWAFADRSQDREPATLIASG